MGNTKKTRYRWKYFSYQDSGWEYNLFKCLFAGGGRYARVVYADTLKDMYIITCRWLGSTYNSIPEGEASSITTIEQAKAFLEKYEAEVVVEIVPEHRYGEKLAKP